MGRSVRSDCKLENFAKNNNLPEEIFKNSNGRKMRKDKTINAIRKEAQKGKY